MYKEVAKNSFFYTVITLSAAVFTLATNILIATIFGVGKHADAYIIVLGFFITLQAFIKGAFFANFTPYFVEIKKNKSIKTLWGFVFYLFLFLSFFLLVVIVALYVWRINIISIIAWGYGGNEALLLHMETLYIDLLFFFGISGINVLFSSILASNKKIAMSSFVGVTQNFFSFSLLFFLKEEWGLRSLTIGYVLGSFFNFFLFSFYLSVKYRFFNKIDFKAYRYSFRYLSKTTIWIFVDFFTRLIPILEKIITGLNFPGAIFIVDIAQKLMNKLIVVICSGLVVSLYPDLSLKALKKDSLEMKALCILGFHLIVLVSLFLMIPILLLNKELASVLFFYGKMQESDIIKISFVIIILCFAVFFQNINDLLKKLHMASKKIISLSFLVLFYFIFYISLSYFLVSFFSYLSIPLAFAVSNSILFIFLYLFFVRERKELSFIKIEFLLKVLILALASYFLSFFVKTFFQELYLKIFVTSLFFLICFLSLGKILKIKEIEMLANFLLKKAKLKKTNY